MPSAATSVRINSDAMYILSALSVKMGEPKAQVIERALRVLEEKVFWADVHSAFEQVANSSEQSRLEKAEFALWDRASNTDLKDESW